MLTPPAASQNTSTGVRSYWSPRHFCSTAVRASAMTVHELDKSTTALALVKVCESAAAAAAARRATRSSRLASRRSRPPVIGCPQADGPPGGTHSEAVAVRRIVWEQPPSTKILHGAGSGVGLFPDSRGAFSVEGSLLAGSRAGAILVISPVGTPCTARCGSPASAWKRMRSRRQAGHKCSGSAFRRPTRLARCKSACSANVHESW
jgi:hypothetical protein